MGWADCWALFLIPRSLLCKNKPKSVNSVQTTVVPISTYPQRLFILIQAISWRRGNTEQVTACRVVSSSSEIVTRGHSALHLALPGFHHLQAHVVFPSLLSVFPSNSCSLPTAHSGDAKLPPLISANILHPPCGFCSSAFFPQICPTSPLITQLFFSSVKVNILPVSSSQGIATNSGKPELGQIQA